MRHLAAAVVALQETLMRYLAAAVVATELREVLMVVTQLQGALYMALQICP